MGSEMCIRDRIGTDYLLQENYEGYKEISEFFKSAMQSHLEA